MAFPTNFTRYRSTDVYFNAESTSGTLNLADSGLENFLLSDVPAMSQVGNFSDVSEIGSSLLNSSKVLNYIEYTDFDFNFFAKPSGTAGTEPAEGTLLEKFFGTLTTSSGVSNTYSFSNSIDTLSVVARMSGANNDDAVYEYAASGVVPTSLSISLAKDGPVSMTLGMRSNRIRYGGTAEVAGVVVSGASSPYTHTVWIDSPTNPSGAIYDADDTSRKMYASDVLFVGERIAIYDASASYAAVTNYDVSDDISVATVSPRAGGTMSDDANVAALAINNGSGYTSGDSTFAIDGAASDSSTIAVGDIVSITDASTSTTTYHVVTSGNSGFATGANITVAPDINRSLADDDVVAWVAGAHQTFTISDTNSSSALADGDLIQPTMGSSATPSTNALIDQQDVAVYLGEQDTALGTLAANAYKINVVSFDITIDRGISNPGINEMSGSAFAPATYVINEVSITGSFSMLCRPSDFDQFEGFRRDPTKALALQIGSTSGKIIQIYIPAAHLEIPAMSESDGVAQQDISFTVVKGSNTADSSKFKMIYK